MGDGRSEGLGGLLADNSKAVNGMHTSRSVH